MTTQSRESDAAAEHARVPRTTSQRVLIVEDDPRLREMLKTSISEMALQPTGAPSAEAALRLSAQQLFAAAVVDLNLPGMSGLEFCKRLHHEQPNVQLIILTGFGDLNAARQAIRLEVVDFLTKPCGMDDLEQALARARERWLDRWSADLAISPTMPAPAPLQRSPHISPPLPAACPAMEQMERELILASLARHGGNRQAAAVELGISVRKLYYRLHQYQQRGLDPKDMS